MNPPPLIKSRLLKQLERDIAAAPTPVLSACSRAKRAMLLARHGALAEARETLTGLHQLAFQHPHPEIGAWLHLAEGLMSYYTDFGSTSRDKIARALKIARATPGANLAEVEALCCAWLAQLAYVAHDYEQLLVQAADCLRCAAPDNHVARARLAMAVALTWHYAGDAGTAQAWYMRARRHASLEGDDAMLSAVMYNMAEMRAAQARHESLSSVPGQGRELLLGVDSVEHYDQALGLASMADLTPILRAQILTLYGDYEQACQLFEQYLPQAMSMGLSRLGSSLLADLAWCRVNCGQHDHALRQAQEAEIELDPQCDLDDRAITHSRLTQVYNRLGLDDRAAQHRQLADQCWADFAAEQVRIRALLMGAGLLQPQEP
ncbi:hypothetical protein ACG0Z6_10740 [Roseateles sp. BYS180W]|uniref:MalT-like TPR region domain-containing protein n=1 Tax=Roseateles rivi TaxID=3299028 RepID=A0ABW7FWL6_9BURK